MKSSSRDHARSAGFALEDASREALLDKIDGLESDLESAVEVAFKRGAIDWTRLNYPRLYERFMAAHIASQDHGTIYVEPKA